MRRAAALLATLALLALPATALAHEEFAAELSGDAEVPPVTTEATGSATVGIPDDESAIDFEVNWENLSGPATMAHIHYGAADEAGPVMIWLTEVGVTDGSYESPISGSAGEAAFMPVEGGPQTFAEALQAIRDGTTYVNVHTEANPGGEIRGQLQMTDHAHDGASPSPDDEATPPPTDTYGSASEGGAAGLAPIALLAIMAVAVFGFGLYRFSFRRI